MEQQKQPQNEENKIIIQDYFAGETPTPTNTNTKEEINISQPQKEITPNLPSKIQEQKEQISTLYQVIQAKTKKNKECSQEEFYKKNRHYFIMTDGGLPVYSRYGDEVENNGIFAFLSATITKYTVFLGDKDNSEKIHYIANEKSIIVFFNKDQLYFIALSKKNDSISLLRSQLEFLYLQLMSILTNQNFERLKINPSKCLTAMSGTDILFEQMIKFTSHSMVSLLKSYQVLPIQNRDRINKICEENRGDALICMVLTPNEIVAIAHSDQIMLTSNDILLLQNLIFSSPSLRMTESWVPFCMPGISGDGYLQLYCHFSDENIGVCMITESVDPSLFMNFSEQYNILYTKLMENNFIEKILSAQQKISKNNVLNQEKEEAFKKMSDEELIDELLIKLDINQDKNSFVELSRLSKTMGNYPAKVTKSMTVTNAVHKQLLVDLAMKDIIFGIVKNEKNNQYFLINFHNSVNDVTKEEKKLFREYNVLLDKMDESYQEKEKDKDYFSIEKGELYTNVIQRSQHFICIFSFNFFTELEDIGQKMRDIQKNLKDNENYYFIMFK